MSQIAHPVLKHGDLGAFWDKYQVHAYLASLGRIRAIGTIVDASKDWLSHYEELVPPEIMRGEICIVYGSN